VPGAVHEGDLITLELSLERPGVLVINEAFTAATTVSDEGAQLDTFPVNHALLGVALAPGSHRIRVERHTPGLAWGLTISVLALGLASFLTLRVIQRRMPKRGSSK